MADPLLSIVVPTCRGADRIGDTLRSLAQQTLAPEQFEVVVVLNGPRDATPERLAEVRRANPALRLRSIRIPEVGASHARNAGIAAAAGAHLTFVDDDDWVAPTFLQALADEIDDGVVPLATVADQVVDGAGSRAEYDNYLNRRIGVHAGRRVPGEVLSVALGFVAAKLIPTALARSARFDTSLLSGEDSLYWFDIFNRAPFLFGVIETSLDATYHRWVRVGSLSRQVASYDFSVSQRLDVIERLAGRTVSHPAAEKVRARMIGGQTNLINGYLREALGEHLRAVEEVRERGLDDVVPHSVLNAGLARDLAICYAFPPYSDPSASASVGRIRSRGVVVDVVSQSMRATHEKDRSLQVVAQEFVGEQFRVAGKPGAFNWPRIERFVESGLAQVRSWEAARGPYRSVFSRSMWPASHVLAALYKIQRPHVRWTAEFSEPQLVDGLGQRRTAPALPGPLLEELTGALEEAGVEVDGEPTVASLVELLAYALADDVVFTNEHQFEVMLGHIADPDLETRVRSIAQVLEQPVPDPSLYHRELAEVSVAADAINVGCFGLGGDPRRLDELLAALAGLSPEQRRLLRLVVVGPQADAAVAAGDELGIAGSVAAVPSLSYLSTLNLATRLDVLVVADTPTVGMHERNPYLPLEWSDFRGSGTDLWSLVEPGSVLSAQKCRYQSRLGDVEGARDQLVAMIESHTEELGASGAAAR